MGTTIKPSLIDLSNKWDAAEELWEYHPYIYDDKCLYWLWDMNRLCYARTDIVGIIKQFEEYTPYKKWIIDAKQRQEMTNAIQVVGRKHVPRIPPDHWIQFKNDVVDILSGGTMTASPNWFFTTPIPHRIGISTETPILDKLFFEWVYNGTEASKQYVQTLYEIMAYCLLRCQPAQRIFALTGSGANGKTTYQDVLAHFLGDENVVTSTIEQISVNRFESALLYHKLACIIGEVTHNELKDTKMIKALTGNDMIRFEFKNKMPFVDKSYATCVISTNGLPDTPDESIAFYRRWLIIDFPNRFSLKTDVLALIPESEYESLCAKCIKLLPRILSEKVFTGEGSLDERKDRYSSRSDPIKKFVNDKCVEIIDGNILFKEFYDDLVNWLYAGNHRKMTKRQVGLWIQRESFSKKQTTINGINGYWIFGLQWKNTPTIPNEEPKVVVVCV